MTAVNEVSMIFSRQMQTDLFGWIALRHFLPAAELRLLVQVMVTDVSEGEISFADLFDEREIPDAPGLDGWVVRPKIVQGRLASYLQRTVQEIIWQADRQGFAPEEGAKPAQLLKAAYLDQAVFLGRCDFSVNHREFRSPVADRACQALLDLLHGGSACILGERAWSHFPSVVASQVSNLHSSIALLIMKHIGDLCADADAWAPAEEIYRMCRERIASEDLESWSALAKSMIDLVDQSIAAAVRVNAGPEAAIAILRANLEGGPLEVRPLLKLNAPFDVLAASMSDDSTMLTFVDDRTALLNPPLSHDSHRLSWSAVAMASPRNRDNVWRRCWAVLRRQTALGLSTESRETMGAYARAILRMVDASEPNRSDPSEFQLAVRLLIQAADQSGVDNVVWSDRSVAMFVDDNLVEQVIVVCRRHRGVLVERHRVVVVVFTNWAEKISQDRRKLAGALIKFISEQAKDGHTSFSANRNLALGGIEAISRLARNRPELCRDSIGAIHSAIIARLRAHSHWNLHAKTIELACLTIDMFSEAQARELIETTLALLDSFGTETQLWPVVGPALQLLIADEVVVLANKEAELGRRIVNTVVTFGAGDRSDAAGIIQYLERFDSSLLEDNVIRDLGDAFVGRLVPSVKRLNTSSNISDIRALLAIPSISGQVGVTAALEALEAVLSSVRTSRPAMGVGNAYAAVIVIAGRRAEFSALLGEAYVDTHWTTILGLIYEMWSTVIEAPKLLAPFSIPESVGPNPTSVHNWTYASLRLARDLDQESEMLKFLRNISSPSGLRDPIELAIATGALSSGAEDKQETDLSNEGDDAFYAGLGRRLVRVLTEEMDVAKQLCNELLQQCLTRGPRGLDAGVLVEANRLKVTSGADQTLVQDYLQRLHADQSMQMALWPLVTGLR